MNVSNATFGNSTLANSTSLLTRPLGYSNGTNYPDGAYVAFAFMIAISLWCCYKCKGKRIETASDYVRTHSLTGVQIVAK